MRTLRLVLAVVLVMALSGYQAVRAPGRGFARRHHSSSSLVASLYPTGALPRAENRAPQLGGAGAFSWGWLVALLPLLVWRARRRAALGDDQDAEASAPQAHPAAHGPAVRSGMRRPRTARSARAIPMRVPRLSVRN